MSVLRIKNVGPISEVELKLNRINVFIGPQSSGKSTIAKIISNCFWVEKDIAVRQSFDRYIDSSLFIDNLTSFHKLNGYIKENTVIEYESDVIKLKYAEGRTSIEWVDQYGYKRSKISYIPSERNMVIMPEMEKMELLDTNVRSFLFDWFSARKTHATQEDAVRILSIPVSYYYDSSKGNHIRSNDGAYDIELDNASSGLQSLTPLVVMVEYLTDWIYSHEVEQSYEQKILLGETNYKLFWNLVIKKCFTTEENPSDVDALNKFLDMALEEINKNNQEVVNHSKHWTSIKNNLFKTSNSNLIIEEPEQNLFPKTQIELVYYLLKKCLKTEREHMLTLTTHSPYVLYALNNCILASKVADKMPERQAQACMGVSVDSGEISVYKMIDGTIESIQEEDGLIGKNYFDEVMKTIMDDYYEMFNHYDYE